MELYLLVTDEMKATMPETINIIVNYGKTKVNVPSILITGGDKGSNANPFDAIGINMLLDIQAKLDKK